MQESQMQYMITTIIYRTIDSRNPALVEHAANDKNYIGRHGNFLCNECPYFSECLNMRKDAGEITAGEEMFLRFNHNNKRSDVSKPSTEVSSGVP